MDFDSKKLYELCSLIETKSANAEDKRKEHFEIILSNEDAKMIVKALLVLDKEIKDCEDEILRLRNEAMFLNVASSAFEIQL